MTQKQKPQTTIQTDEMLSPAISSGVYNGKPSRVAEMQIGNTLFTVISVQSKCAKGTAYDKVKRMILEHASEAGENVSESSNIPVRYDLLFSR